MNKLKQLKQYITDNNLDGIYLNNCDIFLNKTSYIQDLIGFTGSHGTLIIFNREIYLLTDKRYSIQAYNECSQYNIVVVNNAHGIFDWIKLNLTKNAKLACCCDTCTINEIEYLKCITNNIQYVEICKILNYNNSLTSNIRLHQPYFNITTKDKIIKVKLNIKQNEVLLIAYPPIVCWLLNIRGQDNPHTPIKNCFCLIHQNADKIDLFINDISNIPNDLMQYCNVHQIEKLPLYLDQNINLDIRYTNGIFYQWIKKINHNEINNYYTAQYSDQELRDMQKAHLYDAIIMHNFLNKIDAFIQDSSIYQLTEADLAELLEDIKSQYPQFNIISNSFSTISALGKNSALPHYHHSQNNTKIMNNNLYLIDSGRQYLKGTTDVTRTIAIGKVSKEMQYYFTKVLKSHIALSSNTFPIGTTGQDLDCICRSICNYPHSTGHGVMFCGNVHDILPNISENSKHLIKENMVFSIEPGIYIENKYGIRIENLYYVSLAKRINYFKLIPLTLVPIDYNLITFAMLNKQEIKWLNAYHKLIAKKIQNNNNLLGK